MNTLQKLALSAALLLAGPSGRASAHPGGHGEGDGAADSGRAWRLAIGESHVHGSFVTVNDELVQIRQPNGTLKDLPLHWLCDEDRQWVETRRREIEHLNQAPPMLLAQAARGREPIGA